MKSGIKHRPPYFSGFDHLSEKYKGALREDGKPFYLRSEKNKAVVICLHGFSGTTYGIRPVAEACLKVGIDAMAPLMPGHGYKDEESSYKMWLSINHTDFLDGLRNDIKIARKKYEKVFIYGQSMGGMLSLIMSGEGLVDAVATTGSGIMKISKIYLLFMRIYVSIFGGKMKKMNPSKNFYNSAYEQIPLRAMKSILGLLPYSQKMGKKTSCPYLLIVSENDDMINSKKILKDLPQNVRKNTEIEWYNESGHVMTLDVKAKEVCESIARFFKKQS